MFLVRLHVIQFTRYSVKFLQASLAANFYILAHRFQFVKNFFQVFSNFFSIRAQPCRSRDSFDIISLHTPFVNTFFKGNYFYFEIKFLGLYLHPFFPVSEISWLFFPLCYCSILHLRRAALWFSSGAAYRIDAGYRMWIFIIGSRIRSQVDVDYILDNGAG